LEGERTFMTSQWFKNRRQASENRNLEHGQSPLQQSKKERGLALDQEGKAPRSRDQENWSKGTGGETRREERRTHRGSADQK